jgi:hypothetical protein
LKEINTPSPLFSIAGNHRGSAARAADWTACFYQNSLGNEPVRDWVKDLDKEDRLVIGSDIKTVEFGWPIGMPTCKPLGKGLYEVRSNLPL